jgi:hypothetical protein
MPDPAAPHRPPSASPPPRWYPPLQLALAALAWLSGIAGAGRHQLLVAPLAAAALIALHAPLSRHPGDELRLIVSALMIGVLADSLLSAAGLVVPAPFTEQVAPLWQLSLWTLPAAALHTYLRWMATRRALAAVCAASAAALGCLAANRLGALRFPAGVLPALGASALSGGLAMLLMLSWCARIDRQRLGSSAGAPTAQPQ